MGLTRNQYLAEMGIQVWLTRSARAPLAAGPTSEPAEPLDSLSPLDRIRRSVAVPESTEPKMVETEQPRVSSTPAPVADSPAPQFSLVFAEFSDLVMLFEVDYSQDSLAPAQERLISDLGKALGRERQKITSLKWPMLDAAHVKQDQSAADQVIQARLKGSLQGKQHLLVFGDLSRQCAERMSQDRIKQLAVEDLQQYLSEPLKKKTLWLSARAWLEQG